MGDLLAKAAEWLTDQRHQHMARTVTYQRGGDEIELSATIGQTTFEQVDDHGITRTQSRDFLVRAADLVLGSAAVLPISGDRIVETDGAQTYTYEVMAPGGEPPYRYSDSFRNTLRIHTKMVGQS